MYCEHRVKQYGRALRVALGFLTTLPVPLVRDWRDDDLKLAVRAYPLVGFIIGLLLALAFILLGPLPLLLRGVLVTALWLGLTGALHFDGFCDLADAALAPKPPEERWRIVKDPRIGAFALAAGSLLILTKVAGVAGMAGVGSSSPVLLLLAPLLSRTAVLLTMARFPVHDASLLGRKSALTRSETFLPLLLGLALAAAVSFFTVGWGVGLALVITAASTALGLGAWLNRRMGGLGGDAYGAVVESSEALLLTVALMFR